ncbi:hypothetical protein GCM10010321_06090 [Streptomyces chartreusis]|nr:hypothetical protein GCM10010321_06090 [Streptomyces chartreusis]
MARRCGSARALQREASSDMSPICLDGYMPVKAYKDETDVRRGGLPAGVNGSRAKFTWSSELDLAQGVAGMLNPAHG